MLIECVVFGSPIAACFWWEPWDSVASPTCCLSFVRSLFSRGLIVAFKGFIQLFDRIRSLRSIHVATRMPKLRSVFFVHINMEASTKTKRFIGSLGVILLSSHRLLSLSKIWVLSDSDFRLVDRAPNWFFKAQFFHVLLTTDSDTHPASESVFIGDQKGVKSR